MENCGSNRLVNLPRTILLEIFTCAITLFLMLTFLSAAWQNRLWCKNRLINFLLKKIEDSLLPYLLSQSIYLVLVLPFRNDLYFLWAVLLLIGFESTSCITGYRMYSQAANRMYYVFFSNILIVGFFIGFFSDGSKLRNPLWVLWTLIWLKMAERCSSFHSVRRAYGTAMIGLVSDYTQYENQLSSPEEVNPATLQGYKYIVYGEAGAKFEISSDYKVRIDVDNQIRLVTVDKIWRCETGLLSLGNDRLKDLCLSFALFRLLRRSFARSPAAESEQPKTRKLVFDGILAEDDDDGNRAFEVVKAELGFLRDLFHTKYPVIFGRGFPTADIIICLLVLGVMGWLCKVVYHDYQSPPKGERVHYVGKRNVDLYVTYLLGGMIMVMAVTELLAYLFSDWAKVMLVCGHVQGSWLLKHISLSKMLRFICTPTFSETLRCDIGQHSLLSMRRRKNQTTRIKVPPEVKTAIVTSLRQSQGNLSNGGSSRQRNGVREDLGWACKLPTLLHTITVWHIATHYYLLPISARHDAKLVLDKMVDQARTLMKGAKTERDEYAKMMNLQVGGDEETVIAIGTRLGRQLGSINLYERRKVLADLWAELLLYIAPTDNPNAHLEKLEDGGEFITLVWILLYHAGILKQPLTTTKIDV